jgi:hypothetical protein
MPPTIALCDEWVCNKNEASNPATKDDRKQPDATEKIITTLMWIADVSNKGRIFQERAAPWRKSRPISSGLGHSRRIQRISYYVESIRPEQLMLNIASWPKKRS